MGSFDTSYVWFFDNKGRHYFSNDGGETWGYYPDSSTLSTRPWLMWANARNLWLWVSSHSVFCYCYNGYIPRESPSVSFVDPTGLVGAPSTREFWLVKNEVYYTPDAAHTWTSASPNGLNKPTTLIDMVTLGSEVSAWATGIGDTVYHYHRILTGVDEHQQPIPREFSLNQNFPNPFNPSTVISFQLLVSSFVTLNVYNVFGQEVATLVNEVKQPGSYQVTWGAAGLASGVYFYRLRSGSFIETKKLVLVR